MESVPAPSPEALPRPGIGSFPQLVLPPHPYPDRSFGKAFQRLKHIVKSCVASRPHSPLKWPRHKAYTIGPLQAIAPRSEIAVEDTCELHGASLLVDFEGEMPGALVVACPCGPLPDASRMAR